MIYALTEQEHAQQMAALNHGIRTLNHYDLPLKCEQLHEALAILKGLKPLEPCAYVQIEHLQEMHKQAEANGYWSTVSASTHKKVPDNTPLYAPEAE